MIVAGRLIEKPLARVLGYLTDLERTVVLFDLVAGSSGTLTEELVAASWRVSSRISREERRWFAERGKSAPWNTYRPMLSS